MLSNLITILILKNDNNMKVKDEILEIMKTSNKVKARLAYEFDVSGQSVFRWLQANEIDGELTRQKAVNVISEELNVPVDEILTNE